MDFFEGLLRGYVGDITEKNGEESHSSFIGRINGQILNDAVGIGSYDDPVDWVERHIKDGTGAGAVFLIDRKKSPKNSSIKAVIFDGDQKIIDSRVWTDIDFEEYNKHLFKGKKEVYLEFEQNEDNRQRNAGKSKKKPNGYNYDEEGDEDDDFDDDEDDDFDDDEDDDEDDDFDDDEDDDFEDEDFGDEDGYDYDEDDDDFDEDV